MTDLITQVSLLDEKATKTLSIFGNLRQTNKRDIRYVHLFILKKEIYQVLINLKISFHFFEKNKNDFTLYFKNDIEQRNYFEWLIHISYDIILDILIFQTELVFRIYYSNIKGQTPKKEKGFFKIVATLYEDIENNWKKEECNLIVLLWKLRNGIHTGGIYYDKDTTITWKGQPYKFKYGKMPDFLKDGHVNVLICGMFDALKTLFESKKIQNLGQINHPAVVD